MLMTHQYKHNKILEAITNANASICLGFGYVSNKNEVFLLGLNIWPISISLWRFATSIMMDRRSDLFLDIILLQNPFLFSIHINIDEIHLWKACTCEKCNTALYFTVSWSQYSVVKVVSVLELYCEPVSCTITKYRCKAGRIFQGSNIYRWGFLLPYGLIILKATYIIMTPMMCL